MNNYPDWILTIPNTGSALRDSEESVNEKRIYASVPGLEITAGQWTMSGLIWELTGQPFVLPVMLTGHI